MTLNIFVNRTMTLEIFINLIIILKMFINFIGNMFYARKRSIIVSHYIVSVTLLLTSYVHLYTLYLKICNSNENVSTRMLWKICPVLLFTNFFYMYQHTDFIWLFNIYIYIYIYVYVWKLNQTVLELDFWDLKFLFFPRRDLNSHHWYTASHSLGLTSSALDHSTTSAPYIYIHIKSKGIYQPENLMSNGSSRHDDAVIKINYRSLEDCATIRIKMLPKNILTKFSINKWPSSMSFKITMSL